jgi:hypothetical protein
MWKFIQYNSVKLLLGATPAAECVLPTISTGQGELVPGRQAGHRCGWHTPQWETLEGTIVPALSNSFE